MVRPFKSCLLELKALCRAAASLCAFFVLAGSVAAQPANDQCAGAVVINSAEYSDSQSTETATSTGDPSPSCVSGFGNGVWHVYTTTASGEIEVDTAGSDYDTGLAIYTGGCGSLTEVACNDDDLLNGVTTSRIDFTASSGVTYWFLAGGSYGATGDLIFHMAFTPNGPPLITMGPVNQTVAVGSNATFTVTASSLTPLSYAWERNGAVIPGAESASYTLTNAQLSDSGSQFGCVVSNSYGAVSSSAATLIVEQPTLLYHFDFESGLEGFVINNAFDQNSGYTNGLWHVSVGRGHDPGHSPTHSLYYGQDETTNGGGNYDTGSLANAGVVVTPPLSFAGGPITLSFTYFMQVEPVYSYPADLAYVEVSTNEGGSYSILEGKGDGLTNDTGGLWITNVADMSAFAATNVLLRFRFDTVDSLFNDTEGWYVDDITITGLGASPAGLIFQSIAQTNGQVLLTWNAMTNQGYQLQYTTNLTQAQWLDLGAPVTNAPMPFSTPIAADVERFYRVKAAP